MEYVTVWLDVPREHLDDELTLIDFGESFEIAHPPEDLGIPAPYRAPELILDKTAGIGSDLWALACTLFELRTGRKLFAPFDDIDDDYLDAMVQAMGKLPEPWWSTIRESRRRSFNDDDIDENGMVVAPEPLPGEGTVFTFHPSVAHGDRLIKDKLAPGLWYTPELRGDAHREMPHEEIDVFADLLGKLLRYDPKGRISAAAALDHEWFKM
ncbi:hypothetical protein ACO1O0_001745 [Amphichorda felina]